MTEYSVVHYSTVHSWFGRQHFYQGLASTWSRRRPQLFVSSPIRWLRDRPGYKDSKWIGGGYLHQPHQGLWVLEPVITSGTRFRAVRRLRRMLIARATFRALRAIGFDPDQLLVWSYLSDVLPLLDRLPRACSVLWTGDEPVDPMESELLRRVDHVFAISPDSMAQKLPLAGERLTAMPMAIDPEPFIAARTAANIPADLRDLPRPFIGYGGAFNVRIDWEMLRQVASRTTGTLVLVGPAVDEEGAQKLKELSRMPSVAWLGHRGIEEAPAYVAAFDAGLIPYKRNGFNDGSNPVKFYEYLAAGLPIVSAALPSLVGFRDLATFTDDPATFAAASDRAANLAVDPGATQRRQSVAREHSYERLIEKIEERISTSPCFPGR